MNYENFDAMVNLLDASRFNKVYNIIGSGQKSGNLLEVGCLSGNFLSKLKNNGWNCTGIELSDAADDGIKKGLKIIKHDVENGLPFESEVFDVEYFY